jgi:RNA polymerase-binding transcription factor DksA
MNISKTAYRSADIQVHRALNDASRVREAMLAELPDSTDDLVIEAQRFSIECVLNEIKAALARLESGSYGRCLGCTAQIPAERLELRPWAGFCVHCAGR